MNVLMNFVFYVLSISVVVIHSKFIISALSHGNFHTVNHRQHSSTPILKTQNFQVAPGINYEYLFTKGNINNGSKPTILFLHGFPSSLHSWRHQIDYFSQQGHDCLAPNMMGYGKTYSPLNTSEYKSKPMVEHLVTLLNHLQVNKVIVIGHDWGTRAAGRFVLHHPERALGAVLISGGYNQPALFDLNRTLEATKQAFGYETFGHWTFFEANDAAKLIENNVESFMDLAFANDPTLWRTNFAPVGKVREWVTNKNRTTRGTYMTENDYQILRQYHVEGMQPKLNWFKMMIANNDWNDEKNLDPRIQRPMLYLGGRKDYVSVIASYGGPSQYVSDLETVALDTGHWVMEENPQAVNQEIERWIKRLL
jgi:soluble epoxide hydrolase/lipid-phosphate phosphatase